MDKKKIPIAVYAGLIAILLVPGGSYLLFAKIEMLRHKAIFSSLISWDAYIFAAWLCCLFFVILLDRWNDKAEAELSRRGLPKPSRNEIIWLYANFPLILGLLLFLLTIIDRPPPNQDFIIQKLFSLFVGFASLWVYGVFRAYDLSQYVLGGPPYRQPNQHSAYVRTKWRYIMTIGVTIVFTPLFGSAVIVGDLWRRFPKSRKAAVPLCVAIGLVGTLLFVPVIDQIDKARPELLLFYVTFSLFTATSYVCIWKAVVLSTLPPTEISAHE